MSTVLISANLISQVLRAAGRRELPSTPLARIAPIGQKNPLFFPFGIRRGQLLPAK